MVGGSANAICRDITNKVTSLADMGIGSLTDLPMISIGVALVNPANVIALESHDRDVVRAKQPKGFFGNIFGSGEETHRVYEMRVYVRTDVSTVLLRSVAEDDNAVIVRNIEKYSSILGLWRIGRFWVPRNTIAALWASETGTSVVYCVFSHIGRHAVARFATQEAAVSFVNDTKKRLAETPA